MCDECVLVGIPQAAVTCLLLFGIVCVYHVQAPHRFAVINSGGLITDIVAQSDIVMYLHTNRDRLLSSFTAAKVCDLNLGSKQTARVVTVPAAVATIDAFAAMEREVRGFMTCIVSSDACVRCLNTLRCTQSVAAVAIVDDATGTCA